MLRKISSFLMVFAVLVCLVSCGGAVDEKLFCSHSFTNKSIDKNGAWICSNCGTVLTLTNAPYFALVNNDGEITSIKPLTNDYKKGINGLSYTDDFVSYSSEESNTVYLRTTEAQTVKINAPNSTVYQYGKADVVLIEAVESNSYHLNGSVNDLVVRKGHIVLEKNASVSDFAVAKNATGSEISIVKDEAASIDVLAYYNYKGQDSIQINDTQVSNEDAEDLVGTGIVPIDDDKVFRVKNELFYTIAKAKSAAGTDEAVRIVKDTDFSEEILSNEVLKVSVDINVTVPESAGLTVNGTLEVYGDVINKNTLKNDGSIKNYGDILSTKKDVTGTVELNNNETIKNYGSIEAEDGAKITTSGAIENYGEVSVGEGSTLKVEEGASLQNEGTVTNSGTITNDGNVKGEGLIDNEGEGKVEGKGSFSNQYVAKIGETYYLSLNDVVKYLEDDNTTSGTITIDILRDITMKGNFDAELKGVKVVINGNGYTFENTYKYQGTEEEDKHLLSGVLFGSKDYSKYRPEVTINNWTVKSQWEAYYATDTIDITLNSCKGETNLTQSGEDVETFDESVLACSFDAKLVVNGGEFKSSKYGASVYSSGGTIELNDCDITAEYAACVYSPSSKDAVSDSVVSVNGGLIKGDFYEDSRAGYDGHKAKLVVISGTFDHDPSAFIDVDSTVKKTSTSPEIWTVSKAPDQVEVSNGLTTTKMTLAKFRNSVNAGNSYAGYTVKLLCDVDLSGKEWIPIGTETCQFEGNFDGNNHTISGLTKTSLTEEEQWYDGGAERQVNETPFGLFAAVKSPTAGETITFKNVKLKDVNISLGNTGKQVGALIGFVVTCDGNITVDNVDITGTSSVSAKQHVGGIIGKCYAQGSVLIQNCDNSATVSSSSSTNLGGVVSRIQKSTDVKVYNCSNSGYLSTTGSYLGGICGLVDLPSNGTVTFESCTNTGVINGDSDTIGGICGDVDGTDGQETVVLKNLSNSGNITGSNTNNAVGGIIGGNTGGCIDNIELSGTITNSGTLSGEKYVTQVIGHWNSYITGITIDNSKATFALSGSVSSAKPKKAVKYWTFGIESTKDICVDSLELSVSDNNKTVLMALEEFRDRVNAGNSYSGYTVKLLCDVDLSGKEWTPIGTETYPFKGIFDGDGYTVKNMKVTAQGTGGSGFFGCVQGSSVSSFSQTLLFDGSEFKSDVIKESDYDCVIKNLTIENATILLGSGNVRHVSACIGNANKAYIKNIKITGNTLINVYKYGAGIVALTKDVVITNCSVGNEVKLKGADTSGKTDGGGHIGGIVAYDSGEPIAVISCVNGASIENAKYGFNGGIIAYVGGNGSNASKAVIYDCTNNGSIATCGSSQYVGGIVGDGQGSPYILFCTNNGTITGEATNSISGIGSYFCGKLYSCFNYGNISGSAPYIGGLVGLTYQSNLEIENSSSQGTLSNSKEGGITNSYVASSTHGTIIAEQSFAGVQDLENAISGVSGTLILKNITVTDKSGTLHLPATVSNLISDTGYFLGLDISECSKNYITVSIPDFEYTLHGDAAGKTLGLSGVNNKTTFASDCKLDWLRNYGSNGTYIKEAGCVVNLIHGASEVNQ